MSSKHFLPADSSLLVPQCLRAIVAEYPFLSILEREKVVFNNRHTRDRVSLISGGGSGHEPGFYGLVGTGMLSAVAHGEVFASPNYKNVKAAEKICHSLGSEDAEWAGCIFILTNYTGDNLYFGMAAQDLIAMYGTRKIRILRVTDDVAVTRDANALVGRRTLAGIAVVCKLTGAAALHGHSIDAVHEFGQRVIDSTASVNAGLDHVHISGHDVHENFGKLGANELEVGLGIHNEPGVQKLDRIPKNEELVDMLLAMILDQNDASRGYFKHSRGDKLVLFINNLGGVPVLEEKALLYQTLVILKDKYDIVPVRVYTGNFVTSFNAQIFTITLFNASTSITESFGLDTVFQYLDEKTDAVCWPNTEFHGIDEIDTSKQIIKGFEHYSDDKTDAGTELDFTIDPALLVSVIRTACKRVVAKEPDLTEWDTKMGDGDCGHGLKLGAEIILRKIADGEFDACKGSVLHSLHLVLQVIKDDMGGTLGAIIFIFLKGVINEAENILAGDKTLVADPRTVFAKSLDLGLENLFDYTKARVGHRTVMDVLIPFVETFKKSKDVSAAVKVAHDCAEGTRKLAPKLGRATYVGGLENQKDFPPDPGAYGAYEAISALSLLDSTE